MKMKRIAAAVSSISLSAMMIVLLGAAGIAGAVYAKKKKDEDED